MKYIGLYLGSLNELNFFTRLADVFLKQNYKFIFLTNKLSLHLRLNVRGYKSFLIRRREIYDEIPQLEKCFEYRIDYLNKEEAEILYCSVYNAFQEVSSLYTLKYIFIWNGLSVQTLAASGFSKSRGIEARYFELANLPGKIFVNPTGVNAASGLYTDISILNKYNADECEFETWKQEYLEKCSLRNNKVRGKYTNYLFLLDIIGFRFFQAVKSGEVSLLKKIKGLRSSAKEIEYDEYDLVNGNYIFLPLQVYYDTQLIYHSNVDNISAIKEAVRQSAESECDLLVKIHPAEFNRSFIDEVKAMRNDLKFYLVNYCIIELIRYSQQVITINSTAGLQAKIIGKKVKFLGRSFYSFLTAELIKNYILRYLVNAEFNSNDQIDERVVEEIMKIE
jgi:capsular polysaccharide export protein